MILGDSCISGIDWPILPTAYGAQLLAVLNQWEQSQWMSREEIISAQFTQLNSLLKHAAQTVPFYRQRLQDAGISADHIDSEIWRRIPLLTRADIQTAGSTMHSTAVPRDHGKAFSIVTSGSTGKPVQVLGTGITQFFFQALTLREHLWHRRDFNGELASIRFVEQGNCKPPDGQVAQGWGRATRHFRCKGQSSLLDISAPIAEQAEWLMKRNPEYLLSYPSNLVALARHMSENGMRLTKLRQVRTFGELVEPHVRTVCRDVWGVPLVDMYSSQEVGYMAFQCPDHEHYHVQSEAVYLEVLHDDGRPCEPGEIGRIVVTPLFNFASPIIRYRIEDFAEVGEPCPCGRGLPVLNRIVGRQRNMITLPNGEKRWPSIQMEDAAHALEQLPPIAQFQVIQNTLEDIEVKLVAARVLNDNEQQVVLRWLEKGLGHTFRVKFTYVDSIDAGPTGKYEDFRSEVNG